MITKAFFPATVLAVMMVCSCEGLFNDLEPEVKIGKTTKVNPVSNIKSEPNTDVELLSDGTVVIVKKSISGCKTTIDYPSTGKVTAPGEIVIPEETLGYLGGHRSEPCLEIVVENPAPGPIVISDAKVHVGGVEAELPKVTVPSGKKSFYFSPEGVFDFDASDDVNPLPLSLSEKLSSPNPGDVTIDGIGISSIDTKGALRPASSPFSISVSANLKFPLVYKGGTVLTFDRTFTDLGIDLSKYDIKAGKFAINADVTNTTPFEIAGKAESSSGLDFNLDTPVKGSTDGKPVETQVKASVNSAKTLSEINNASVHFTFKVPAGGASLKDGQGLSINYKTIKVSVL